MKGEVFFKPDHKFPDGGIADKLLIALNDPSPSKNCLFVLTTTKQWHRNPVANCYDDYYVIAKGVDFLKELTWVLFDPNHIVEYDYKEYIKMDVSGKIRQVGKLKDSTLGNVINCFKRSLDVIQPQIDLLD